MFKIPDRAADLFGDHQLRVEFDRALRAAGKFEPREEEWFYTMSFSGAARTSYRRLARFDRASLPTEQRELVAGVKALTHRLITSGYAIDAAAKAGSHVNEDWPDLVDFVQRKCTVRVGLPDHEGWERCFTHIVGRAEAAVQLSRPAEDRDAAYVVLQHFASFFRGDAGFERTWLIEVPEPDAE
ncbi:hypothetical protein [Streptomyces sp. NBC_00338]|uniref:hypothetical protein n=1 Tax=Streptomyces sp. NBC_00338 TaxID=2975715 RepID=UPI0022500CD2|nr:hypothetical protein [Streptomyces sp. NBC_00338]MCX5144641.1 hypothetical protein [Streptomyces sp. NBC_00338]MCX5145063.1 hypothetical protein [Streptomyces sp. NBC_00338]